MGNITQDGVVTASGDSRHRKRPGEIKAEDEKPRPHKRPRQIKDEDDEPSSLLNQLPRRQSRHSRSRTPSPSRSLGPNDLTVDEEESTPYDNLPASLDRHACLRCVKFLASEPEFECQFTAHSTMCTRCTRLNSKCEPIPICADAEARRLLVLQAQYDDSSPREAECLPHRVVVAAEELAVSVRMEAQRRPKSDKEIQLAILRGQEEIIGLLRGIKGELAAKGREEKRNGKGRETGRIRLRCSGAGPASLNLLFPAGSCHSWCMPAYHYRLWAELLTTLFMEGRASMLTKNYFAKISGSCATYNPNHCICATQPSHIAC